jgi:hypothetical protein
MGFTLKHRESDSRGAFVAWGTGFHYSYDPDTFVLSVLDARNSRPLLRIDFDHALSEAVTSYVEILEKTTQIDALTFSNSTTSNLPDIFDDRRLVPILEGSAKTAFYALDLANGNYARFGQRFCSEFSLKEMTLRTAIQLEIEKPYYFAKLETVHNNAVSAYAPYLHIVMLELARKTVQNLIAAEYGYHMQNSAHNLLMVSSKLSILARILDERYVPALGLTTTYRQASLLQTKKQ